MILTKLFGTKHRGDRAEQFAEQYLNARGLKLVARNYRCRFGEIDLVMQDGSALVFIEVRLRQMRRQTRGGNDFGGAAASITATKQARIVAAAQHYLAGLKQPPPCRFDAVLLNQLDDAHIEWIKDAFSA